MINDITIDINYDQIKAIRKAIQMISAKTTNKFKCEVVCEEKR